MDLLDYTNVYRSRGGAFEGSRSVYRPCWGLKVVKSCS